MKPEKIKTQPHTKEYQLSNEEMANMQSRAEIKTTYLYLTRVIERDMAMYVNGVIKKRLGLKVEDELEIDTSSGKARLIEKSPSIVVPKDAGKIETRL